MLKQKLRRDELGYLYLNYFENILAIRNSQLLKLSLFLSKEISR